MHDKVLGVTEFHTPSKILYKVIGGSMDLDSVHFLDVQTGRTRDEKKAEVD